MDDEGHRKRLVEVFSGKTDEEVKAQLIEAYNRAMEELPNVVRIEQKRIERNSPCPCGSGEKFKKCCLWKVVAEPPVPITPSVNEELEAKLKAIQAAMEEENTND
jgi:hypothetical protein